MRLTDVSKARASADVSIRMAATVVLDSTEAQRGGKCRALDGLRS